MACCGMQQVTALERIIREYRYICCCGNLVLGDLHGRVLAQDICVDVVASHECHISSDTAAA